MKQITLAQCQIPQTDAFRTGMFESAIENATAMLRLWRRRSNQRRADQHHWKRSPRPVRQSLIWYLARQVHRHRDNKSSRCPPSRAKSTWTRTCPAWTWI